MNEPVPQRSAPGRPAAPTSTEHTKRYFRIGEVSQLTGVKPYVLRYWESEFRWMAPQKSRSQQRLYRQRDIEIIQLIRRLLYEERFTIAGARRKLREMGISRALEAPVLPLALGDDAVPRTPLGAIREELVAIRELL